MSYKLIKPWGTVVVVVPESPLEFIESSMMSKIREDNPASLIEVITEEQLVEYLKAD